MEKSATKQLHFFVRYAIMHHSGAQMSLIQKQIAKSVFAEKIK